MIDGSVTKQLYVSLAFRRYVSPYLRADVSRMSRSMSCGGVTPAAEALAATHRTNHSLYARRVFDLVATHRGLFAFQRESTVASVWMQRMRWFEDLVNDEAVAEKVEPLFGSKRNRARVEDRANVLR